MRSEPLERAAARGRGKGWLGLPCAQVYCLLNSTRVVQGKMVQKMILIAHVFSLSALWVGQAVRALGKGGAARSPVVPVGELVGIGRYRS